MYEVMDVITEALASSAASEESMDLYCEQESTRQTTLRLVTCWLKDLCKEYGIFFFPNLKIGGFENYLPYQ